MPTTDINLLPITRNPVLPRRATARTRDEIPSGYGVQEQCLPFAAAASLGLMIPAPFSFGICPIKAVPAGAKSFRSPVTPPANAQSNDGTRVYYVVDNPDRDFVNNAFQIDTPLREKVNLDVQPGLSFFDRLDQQNLFKIHLPYCWNTTADLQSLFIPAINRQHEYLTIYSGLVESDWYPAPVNLAAQVPPDGASLHVAEGDPIAQVIFVNREHNQAQINRLQHHNRLTRNMIDRMVNWYQSHSKDRSAYKKLSKHRQ